MKKYLGKITLAFIFISAFYGTIVNAETLPVPTVSQLPQTNWCWAASSQAVLSFTGNAPGMCNIADWARQQNAWGSDNCCTNGTGAICNQPNAMWGAPGSIENIFSHWGADSKHYTRSLSLSEVKKYIDDDSPIIVRWGWTAGGGHFVVLHGYTGSNMDIMDPWSGPTTLTHSNLVRTASRTWTHTLIAIPKKVTYVVDDTGSMWDEIASVKTALLNQINSFKTAGQFTKYTLVTYKDYVSFRGSTVDHDIIAGWVGTLYATGGDDCPEEGYGALDMAADKAPKSEIWWMTDADSHGGFLRMALTKAKLWLAGCKLHSTILGACTARSLLIPSSQSDSVAFDPNTHTRIAATTLDDGNVNAYTAGEELSSATGGVFFDVDSSNIANATEIILSEMSSTILLRRISLAAGSHETTVTVDESTEKLQIILDIPAGATGTLSVRNPDGNELIPGTEGVSETIAGASRMLLITPPALINGTYTISTSSDVNYVLNVSGTSLHSIEIEGSMTIGTDKPRNIKMFIPTLSPLTGLAGPGDEGPGGAMPDVDFPDPDLPFNPANLRFFVEREDGSSRENIELFDDGLHDDNGPNDGIYGGTIVLETEGRFYVGVTDGELFERITKQVIGSVALSVSVDPMDSTVIPGSTVIYDFTVENLGESEHTFDVGANSSAGWADLSSVPATITLDGKSSTMIQIEVIVPATAVEGEEDILTLSVVLQDDPSVTNSFSVKTVCSLNQAPNADAGPDQTVNEGATVTLDGSGSSDPDGVIASYLWSQNSGTSVTLSDTNSINPTFTAPSVGSAGETLTFKLTIVDNGGLEDSGEVSITVSDVPEEVPEPAEDDGGGCFITTACYGTPMAEEVKILSTFRDKYLLTNPTGQAFVRLYYKYSPSVAKYIRERKSLKAIIRECLEPIVWIIHLLD